MPTHNTLPAPPVQLDARALASALGGDLAAPDSILAPGPGHSARDRSLSVKIDPGAPDGFVVTSFAGDSWRACRDHVRAAAGIERGRPAPAPSPRPARPAPDDQDRIARALAIWNAAQPVPDTLGERYLAGRGIALDLGALDHVIRFSLSCPWGRERVPALLVRMQTLPAMNTCGIQRIALTPEGQKLGKKMLGRAGYAFMAPDGIPGPALLTEGPEDALAALMRYRLPVWAAMSAGGLSRFPVIQHWTALAILADGDGAGRIAALDVAQRWRAAGRKVHILDAPDGQDPNLMIQGASHE